MTLLDYNDIMNLDQVNAMLVLEDGSVHPFGIKKMLPPSQLGDENYHDSSFMQEVYHRLWFRKTEFPFRREDGFSRQMGDMAGFGITILCNSSYALTDGNSYYCYLINVPEDISEPVRNYLSEVYPYIKGLILEHDAYFQGSIFLPNGDYVQDGNIFDIDEFYERLNIPISVKVRSRWFYARD